MRLRGAIVGFGAVAAQGHLPGWGRRPDIQIVAVCDPIAERRHEALRTIPDVRVYDDLELMLDGERLDFVDVASPPAFHAPAAEAALAAGAHVLVEKPLCLNRDQFERLVRHANERSRVLMCVHNWKHAPAYRMAHNLAASGKIGAPSYLSFVRLRTGPAGGTNRDAWRLARARGGGILIDHGWHVFYLMHWLTGGAKARAVSAWLELSSDGQTEESADIRVTCERGCLVHAHLSWNAPVRRTSTAICGQSGLVEIDEGCVTLTEHSDRREVVPIADEADNSYHPAWFAAVAADFEAAIAEGTSSEIIAVNQAEARAALRIIEAARESSDAGGAPVRLDP
jgi:predicted dehydrogenase